MLLRLPAGLHFPITVTELLKQPSDDVAINEPLFRYDFEGTVQEDDYLGETHTVKKTFPGVFESSLDGTLSEWFIRIGQVIRGPLDLAEIMEQCTHEVQYHGICAICGKDMTELSYNKQQKDTVRASINMVHDDVNLKISTSEASRSEEEAKRRLIKSRRLSLVVDLDQTIIHATVDPTVGEWQQDPNNPNHAAVADVKSFQLTDDGPSSRACWYYIKTRPGLNAFLERVSQMYELHIYTMGTRSYAQQIAKIVDPDGIFFADRILSRDESGSLTAKSLQRLFPIDTKMVVIIDDRGDVWRWNDNLVKVTPYDFFVGIGDINSSFLPQKPKIQTTPNESTETSQPQTNLNGSSQGVEANGDPSAIEQLVSMGGGDDPEKLKDQTEKAAQAIDSQLEQRPLLQKQIALDKAEEEDASQPPSSQDSDTSGRERHHLLEDHDSELRYLEQSLRQVHQEFYDGYEKCLPKSDKGSREEPVGDKDPEAAPGPDLSLLPDIKIIMPAIKRRVLDGVSIVFSGVVPLGVDVLASDISIWATSFGASVRLEVLRSRTTHVVAARKGTAKVKEALRYGKGRIKVVGTQWLMDSIVRWKRQDETPYLLHSEADDISPADPRTGIEEDDADVLSESEEPAVEETAFTDGDTTDAEQERRQGGLKLRLKTGKSRVAKGQDEGDEFDESDIDATDLSPETPFDDSSPIGNAYDWQDMDDEVADFMDDVTDSDSDSETAVDPIAKKKEESIVEAGPAKSMEISRKRQSGDEEDEFGQDQKAPPRKKLRDMAELDKSGPSAADAYEDNEDDDDGFEEDFEKAWAEDDAEEEEEA